MIPELGHFALVLALVISLLLASLPLVGAQRGIVTWIAFAKPAAQAQFVLIAFAYICLTYAFLQDDFSVKYVASHSNSHLPLIYKISGVWGGHEGSLLLWVFILSVWSGAVSLFTRSIPESISATVLAVMGMLSVGFLLFMLFTSNPFERMLPVPAEGRDLNPLLQDFGLAVHPPILYLGYVGFSVAFSFALTAMISGRFDAAWARWSRPWTNIAWMFLTIGIALGSWWAYYELGWGGWWFWDPVENASFMPWLIGTALIHSLAATEKRGVFKAWTILLAVFAFSLSLLGTFLVRSGVLISVHAFATDPSRGLFILIFLSVVIGGSLLLYAWRAPTIMSHVKFEIISRETAILLNNIFFGVLCFAVLLGTLYPLVLDALGLGKISVGPPYFNLIFALIGLPLVMLIGIGALIRWKKDRLKRINRVVIVILAISATAGLSIPLLMPHYSLAAALGVFAGSFVIILSLKGLADRGHTGRRLKSLATTPRGFYGMTMAHIGIGVFVIGVTLTNVYSVERDIRMQAGEQYSIYDYQFIFNGTERLTGPNYQGIRGKFEVLENNKPVTRLFPEKRIYLVQKNPMTEAAIDPGFFRDLYIALGEPLENDQVWAVRIYFKPFIRWIWLGALIMALGGFLGATDRRYGQKAATAKISKLANLAT
ncbi:heme lyase CcmF/NrfE family subunit [Candidatus Spongiihabitans sp.]|uniref:heme lyase CcmF/NrfE family subunit n=1 Tax=Candidatus Spongiihabitans sp. TaxID=3101308 RepID=UPI003C6F1B7A